MKLIMENWRSFLVEEGGQEIPDDEMKDLIFQAIEGLGLSKSIEEDLGDKIFRSLVGGGFLAMIPMILGIFSHQAENRDAFRTAMAQSAQTLESNDTKIDELNKQVNDSWAPWQWSNDTVEDVRTGELVKDATSLEMFPTIDFDKDGTADASVLAPSWSIAMDVLQDKQAGTVHVPGYAEGEVPPIDVITNALTNSLADITPEADVNATTFIDDFGHAIMYTGDLGATAGKGIQQIDNINLTVSDAGEINVARDTVAVNPAAFDDHPNYKLPDSGQTAQDTYIKYFFGEYLGAEEALKYGSIQ